MAFVLLTLADDARAVDCQTTRHSMPRMTVCRVDLTREILRLYSTDERGRPFHSFEQLERTLAAQGEQLEFAINGGMFHADFTPVGLLVIDGEARAPLNLSEGTGNFFLQPNGVFFIGPDGAWVMATRDFNQVEAQPLIGSQSGPMLVYRGEIPHNAAFASKKKVVRNGVCTPGRETILFGISEEPATLREFAEYFRNALRCSEALYLDGAISSLYSKQLRRGEQRANLGPIFAEAQSDQADDSGNPGPDQRARKP